ncbi:MAG: DUF58 domain-containing protein [Armatimonadota bacterium]|nr:DUF58 domain-containing protein [Armatimonadota bacterium]
MKSLCRSRMNAECHRSAARLMLCPAYAGLKLLSIFTAALFLLIVAGTWNVDYMFIMGSVLLALPVVSAGICALWARALSCERRAIGPMTEGGNQEIAIVLRQPLLSNLTVMLSDNLPAAIKSDREMPAPLAISGTSSEFTYNIEALKRGLHQIGPISVTVYDPLGLIGLTRRFGPTQELIVYPKPIALESWPARSSYSSAGTFGVDATASPSFGGMDFYGTRKYYPGDDLRRVHWKSAARAGELIVAEYLDEADAYNVTIAVDVEVGTDIGDGLKTTLDYTAGAAAYIAERQLEAGGRVALMLGEKTVVAETPRDMSIILDALARMKADSNAALAQSLLTHAPHSADIGALVIISSKVDDSLRSVARGLSFAGMRIIQVYIDPDSFRGEKSGGDIAGAVLDADTPFWLLRYGGDL